VSVHAPNTIHMTNQPNSTRSSGPGLPDGTDDSDTFVLGGGNVGETVAARLDAAGHAAAHVDETYAATELPGYRGDPADLRTLRAAGLAPGATVFVSTPSDRRNLLIAQLVATTFENTRTVVLANARDRFELFADAGHEPVCATTALSEALVDSL